MSHPACVERLIDTYSISFFFFFFFFYHTTCESTCDTLTSSAANQGDNTVSVAQGGTATPDTLTLNKWIISSLTLIETFNTRISQFFLFFFCNILVTYLLNSSSYNKSILTFKVETIMLQHLESPFCQFLDPTLIPVLVLWGEGLLPRSFHFLLVVETSHVQEIIYVLEKVILQRN